MPRKSNGGTYPSNWKEIADQVKEDANWCCVRCGHPHDPASGYTLTVHHLDMNPTHSDLKKHWWNLAALCQRCHLHIQAKVRMDQVWPFEHSEWFKVYAAGFYAHRYLGQELSRKEVEERLEELLGLERVC